MSFAFHTGSNPASAKNYTFINNYYFPRGGLFFRFLQIITWTLFQRSISRLVPSRHTLALFAEKSCNGAKACTQQTLQALGPTKAGKHVNSRHTRS